jgi:hypothetical protein
LHRAEDRRLARILAELDGASPARSAPSAMLRAPTGSCPEQEETMRLAVSTALAVLSLAPVVMADEAAPGFVLEDLPGTLVSVTLPGGDYVVMGTAGVIHYEEDGTLIQNLHFFSNVLFAAGIAVDPTATFVVACRDDGIWSETWRIDLDGGSANLVNSLSGHDVVFLDQDTVLMTSSLSGGGAQVQRVDLVTGNYSAQTVPYSATISSIALDAAGNLYLTHDPHFGRSTIERFDAAQLAGPGLLAPGGGTVLYSGLSNVQALQVSADGSTLFATESGFSADDKILQLHDGTSSVLAVVSQTSFHLQFVPHSQPAQYVAGQPAFGGYLVFHAKPVGGNWGRKALLPTRRAFPVK